MKIVNTYKKNRRGGFTLVELIVVLVILSILAAVAVPSYLGFVDDNKAKQCETHRKALAARLEEMSALGSTVSLSPEEINSGENGCPAGGNYTSTVENGHGTISCDKHGDTTVILKSTSTVTAKVENVQTEAPAKTPEPTPPPENNSAMPDWAISVTSQYPSMNIDAQQTISANIIKAEDCTTPYSFAWSCDPNTAEIVGDSTGQTIEIKAKSAGQCNISCTATATTEEGQISDSEDVTVNIEYVVPHLSFSITPESLEMEVGADSKTLTVNWRDDYYCRVDSFDWWAEPADNVSLSVNADGTVATVTALKATSAEAPCVIHCKAEATADAKAGGQKLEPVIVDVPVTVKSESKKQKLLKNIPDPLLINGNDNGINMSQYVETEGGVWSTNSSNIVCSGEINNHWIQAKAAGECEYTYTLKGESESVEARVVYPIRGFYSTTDTTNILTMKIGESNWEFPANPDPGNTTDVSANWVWGHSGEDGIISYSLNPEKTKATVTALSEGYVELEVSARSEYETWKNGSDVWKTLKWKINVIDPNKLTGISVNNIGMKVNDARQIQVNCNPSGANREGISFDYSGYGDCISIDANGNIKAEKKGSTTVTVQARKNGKNLDGISCTFNVAVTDLQSIAVEPQNVDVKSGETTTAKIVYKPEEADISQVDFVPEGFDPNYFVISQNEKGKLEIQGKQACNNVGVYVKARVYGDEVAASNFQVSVTSDSNSTTEPTAIELVLRNGLPNVMQGKKITVTKYPDETGDIIVCPVPRTASLDAYRISSWPGDYNLIGGDGIANTYNTGRVTFYADATRDYPQAYLQAQVDLNIVENPKILRGIQVSPPQIEMNIEDVIDIVIATPDDTSEENDAAISISPVPTTAEIPTEKIQYWSENSGIASVSNDGVIAAHSTGVTNIKMKVVNEHNQMIGSEQSVTVVVKPTTVSFNDKVIPLASWDELRDYIISRKHGGAVSPLPQTNIYAAAYNQYGGAENGYYIIRPGVELTWDDSYSNDMTFDQYLNQGNREKFVRLEKDKIASTWEQVQWLYEGLIVFRNDGYYVYIGEGKNPNISWTEAQMCENGFVKIT